MHTAAAKSNTISHVTRSVYRHGFSDARDWASGLEELADLSEDQIESIAIEPLVMCVKEQFEGDYFPFAPLFGVTPEQAIADRKLFRGE